MCSLQFQFPGELDFVEVAFCSLSFFYGRFELSLLVFLPLIAGVFETEGLTQRKRAQNDAFMSQRELLSGLSFEVVRERECVFFV